MLASLTRVRGRDRPRRDRGGRIVDCITTQRAVRIRDAYAGDADDRADVPASCRRFDLPVPVLLGTELTQFAAALTCLTRASWSSCG
jgi:hypothetical protein